MNRLNRSKKEKIFLIKLLYATGDLQVQLHKAGLTHCEMTLNNLMRLLIEEIKK